MPDIFRLCPPHADARVAPPGLPPRAAMFTPWRCLLLTILLLPCARHVEFTPYVYAAAAI